MLKVIFSDLDDTFLYDLENKKNNMYTIPNRSLLALREIEELGIKFVITTGRMYGETLELLKRNNIQSDLIVMDGCVAFDKETHALVDYQGISNEDTLSLMQLLNEHELSYFICDDRNYYGMNYQWMWLEQAIKDDDLEVTRFIVHGDDVTLDNATNILKNHSNKFEIFRYPTNIVISNKNTSKGQAVNRFMNKWNIELDEIAVFGDGINDESMFKLGSKSIFIEHGKSMYAKQNASIIAPDFYDGWLKLKKEYNLK